MDYLKGSITVPLVGIQVSIMALVIGLALAFFMPLAIGAPGSAMSTIGSGVIYIMGINFILPMVSGFLPGLI